MSGPAGATLWAVVPVRDGVLPLGGDEAVAEAGGRAVLVGDGCTAAAEALTGLATEVRAVELDDYAPNRAATAVLPTLRALDPYAVVLPASADGRDLAPLVAHHLGRPLLAGAVRAEATQLRLLRQSGRITKDVVVDEPFVTTLQPGVRGVEYDRTLAAPVVTAGAPAPGLGAAAGTVAAGTIAAGTVDPAVVEITPPDPATLDLAEATRIVGGGAGLGSAEVMARLGEVAAALGCSIGATRVVTDWGWVPFERQIGTTGVAVHPELYLAFGISGAVQHTAGLGDPAHVVAVNTDAACPMMQLADLAVVTDAPATVAALLARLAHLARLTGADDVEA